MSNFGLFFSSALWELSKRFIGFKFVPPRQRALNMDLVFRWEIHFSGTGQVLTHSPDPRSDGQPANSIWSRSVDGPGEEQISEGSGGEERRKLKKEM